MHDWVHFHDKATQEIQSSQTYELMAYLPYSMLSWYTQFSLHANASSEFERANKRARLDADFYLTPFQSPATSPRSIMR